MAGWKKYLGSLGRHRALKLLSLALALAAWLALGAEEQVETTLAINLELVNIPKDLMVISEVPAQIEARVQGRRSLIRDLHTARLNKRLDLAGYRQGTHVFPLSPGDLGLPPGLTVNRIRPQTVTVSLDYAMVRRIPVQAVVQGKPATGYKLERIDLKPQEVEVRGPKKDLEQINILKTMPIDVTDLSAAVSREVELDLQKLLLTYVEKKPVVARITIRPREETKVLSNIRVVPTEAAGPVRLSPSRITATIRGPAPQMQDILADDLEAEVSLKNLKPGRHQLKISLSLPPDLEVVSLKPDTVRVRLLQSRNP